MARMVGKFAVKQGQTEATKAIGKASEQATARLNELSRPGGSNGPAVTPRSTTSAGSPAANVPPIPPAVDLRQPPPATPAGQPSPPSPDASISSDGLAIADYDSLAASQVIPRLPGLSSAELEDVRSYELGHRGRKTILNRIAQLQSV
jgi:hypothetical protein